MKTANSNLIDFLNTATQMTIADLYTFSIRKAKWVSSGSNMDLQIYDANYYYSSLDIDTVYNGNNYKSTDLLIERSKIKTVIGVEVDTLNLNIYASSNMVMEGFAFIQAAAGGVLDGASVVMDRAYLDSNRNVIGTTNMFTGQVAQVQVSRSMASVQVKSDLDLLNIQMPRNLYQSGCQHSVYDAGCGVSRAGKSAISAVKEGSASVITPNSLMGSVGYWDLGSIIFTSGKLSGMMRTISSWDGAHLNLVLPLPGAPDIGDTFLVYPGCDKTQATCQSKFNNVMHFKGFPYIPAPETVV